MTRYGICIFFDKELKQAFFEAILNAESHLRAVFAYRFAEIFPSPSYAYLHTDCYDNSKILSVGSTISRISGLINYQKGIPGTSIRHYFHQYHNVPIWVLVNHMDFGTLRYMLSSVQSDLQNAVAKDMRHFIDAHIPGRKNSIRKRMNRLGNCLVSISLDDVLSLLGFPPNWNRNPKLPQV